MNEELWVLMESSDGHVANVTLEMLTECRKLASRLDKRLCACVLGNDIGEGYVDLLERYGARRIYVVKDEALNEYMLDRHVSAMEELMDRYEPVLLFVGATSSGSELAPRIAARLKWLCITGVKKVAVARDGLKVEKSCHEGNAYLEINVPKANGIIMTISPGEMDKEEAKGPLKAEVVRAQVSEKTGKVRMRNLRYVKGDPRLIRVDEADKVVAIGGGLSKEQKAMIEEFADLIGATVGGSRVGVDKGLVPFERQIGITGKTVSPRFLIACGISGANEFIRGIEKAELKAGINIDPKAPVFEKTDLCLLGDVGEIIAAAIKGLKRRNEKLNG